MPPTREGRVRRHANNVRGSFERACNNEVRARERVRLCDSLWGGDFIVQIPCLILWIGHTIGRWSHEDVHRTKTGFLDGRHLQIFCTEYAVSAKEAVLNFKWLGSGFPVWLHAAQLSSLSTSKGLSRV